MGMSLALIAILSVFIVLRPEPAAADFDSRAAQSGRE